MTDLAIQAELDKVRQNYRSDHLKQTVDLLSATPDGRERVAQGLAELIRAFPKNIDTLTKATLLYDVLTGEITYNREQMDTHKLPYTLLDGLFQNKAVCMGIAELYTVLATGLGLQCMHVVGYADDTVAVKGGLHAWNIILLDDKQWYFLDPTFDLHRGSFNQRRWFLKSEADMRGHYLDLRQLRGQLDRWRGGSYPMAQCSWNRALPTHPETARLRELFRGIHP